MRLRKRLAQLMKKQVVRKANQNWSVQQENQWLAEQVNTQTFNMDFSQAAAELVPQLIPNDGDPISVRGKDKKYLVFAYDQNSIVSMIVKAEKEGDNSVEIDLDYVIKNNEGEVDREDAGHLLEIEWKIDNGVQFAAEIFPR
jgi:hypothetical protein